MPRLRTRADINRLYNSAALKSNPGTPLGLATSLRVGGGLRSGYISALNRQQKKVKGQLNGIPGCGPRISDWLKGY